MVRVCLYLALALGLAGSVEGQCTETFAAATYGVGTAVDGAAACANPGTANSIADAGDCTLKCKNTHWMKSTLRADADNALLKCTGTTFTKDITCTARTAQPTTKCATPTTTASAASNIKVQDCAAAKPGFYLLDGIATECMEQKNCATSDKAVACVGTSTKYYHCKTTADGYYIATDAGGIVTECADTAGSDGGRYGYQDSTSFPTFGKKCAKADGLLNTGKVTIDQCPPGAYKVVTKDADDKCMKCEESGNSRCHCTKAGGATSCLATGICNTGFWKYTGKAGEAGSCTAHTDCTTPVGKLAFPAGTGTTDATCVDCVQIPNVAATGVTCNDLVRSSLVTNSGSCGAAGTVWTNTAADSSTPCVSPTCTCGDGNFMDGTECKACSAVTGGTGAGTTTCTATGNAAITAAKCGRYHKKWVSGAALACTACEAAETELTTACTSTQYEDVKQCTATLRSVCAAAGAACTGQQIERGGSVGNLGATGTDVGTTSEALEGSAHDCTATVTAAQTYSADKSGKFTLVVKGVDLVVGDRICITDEASCDLTISECIGTNKQTTTDLGAGTLSGTTTASPLKGTTLTWELTNSNGVITNSDAYKVCFLGSNIYTGANKHVPKLLAVGSLTVKTAALTHLCLTQEWAKSHPSCGITTIGTVGTNVPLSELGVTVKNGYKDKCAITCSADDKQFTVVAASACTEQEGCKTSAKTSACVGTDKDKYSCSAASDGYFLKSSSAIFKCTTGVGQEAVACNNDGFCWYQGDCKSGYTKTLGNAKKSDTCVSDSAASLSLTAVLLSVVAKVFLF